MISASGEFFIIDFNDWPSFARCREDAARAIAGLVERINENGNNTNNNKTFKELLHDSMKSQDTEEWLDIYFTRPIGLFFALIWKRLGVHPNAITILSIFLGIGAAVMFGTLTCGITLPELHF